jgi:purine nucleosidase/pyrimidine-specific ribonucleoside hydrolase
VPTPCVLDCDPGHDDAIAILLAASLPELDLRAITTVAGNGTLERTTENARRVAALAGLAVPIAAGAEGPLRGTLVTAPDVHGRTALDGPALPEATAPLDPRHAVDLLADVLLAAEEPVTVIATGPLANVALLLRRGPDLRERIAEIVLMGGSTGRGNVTPAAEFNIYVDPEAADEVFTSGLPLRMAGLDLTHQALATDGVRARMRALGTELGRIADEWLDFFAGTYRSLFGLEGPPVHDPCAVAWRTRTSSPRPRRSSRSSSRGAGPAARRSSTSTAGSAARRTCASAWSSTASGSGSSCSRRSRNRAVVLDSSRRRRRDPPGR